MPSDLNVIQLVMDASIVVQLVMALLLAASLASWAVILRKRAVIRQARARADSFENTFWSGGDLNSLYRDIARAEATPLGMAGIFEAGYREFGRLRQESGLAASDLIEGARRAMHVSQTREVDGLEHNLAFLATVGSTSPYVGLFGTVWGIMESFMALSGVQTATIAMVAPGISHALIATAMGLFAAIPAVIFYNRFADRVDRLEVRYDTFREELAAILQRSAVRKEPARHGGIAAS